MKVLLIGCGAVGLGIAASLYDSGVTVDLIAHGKTKEAIVKGGIRRAGVFKDVEVPPENIKVFEKVSDTGRTGYDFVLVATKTTSNQQISEELGNIDELLSEEGKIVLFQNGFENTEPFLDYFSMDQVCSARVITGYERPEPNVSKVTAHSSATMLGSQYGSDVSALSPLAEAIAKGGVPCEVNPDIGKAIWAKMLYNCTLNPLSAVLRVNYGKLAESRDAMDIMNKIIDEMFAVMRAAHLTTYWASADTYKRDFYEKILPPTYEHRASTLQDVERGIKTEIDTLNGVVVRLGEKYGIETPYNAMICKLIKATESYY